MEGAETHGDRVRMEHDIGPPLSVALSDDDGLTWSHVRDLEAPTEPHIEVSHPTVSTCYCI